MIRAFDWSATPLGPIESWPHTLKTAAGLLLQSPVPMVLLWGAEGVMIYNDAYAVVAGRRHPAVLGAKVREAWPEVADFNDNVMKVGLAGRTLAYKDQELMLDRNGVLERAWMNLDYSPVLDESGVPAGVIAIVVETTDRVLADRRIAAEQERQQQLFKQMPGFVAVVRGPDHVYEYVNDAYVKISERTDFIGRRLRDVFPDLTGQGFYELLDQVYETGNPVVLHGTEMQLRGREDVQFIDMLYQPIRGDRDEVTGIFVAGYEVTDSRRATARRDALVELTDRIGELEHTGDVQFEAAKILGDVLRVSRVGYGMIDPDTEILTVDRDWTAPEVETLVGSLHLRDYGSFVENLKRGEFVAVSNVETDPRTAPAAAALIARSAHSFVNVPVMERGRLVAVLFVNHDRPRAWAEDDLALIREVAARTRMASERVRSATALRESEARLRFLDALGKDIAARNDADAILAATTRLVGEQLGVSICAYADVDEDEDGFTVRGEWAAPEARSIVGRYSLRAFGDLAVRSLRGGLPLIVDDVSTELDSRGAATFQSIGVLATICMPLVKAGRLTAMMAVHNKTPRVWTEHEIAIVREVTERSWAHVERVGAEVELRANEENFRTLARAMPNHVWTATPDGALDWFNDRVYAYSGAAVGALDGANWTSIVHPEDLAAAGEVWAKALQSGETYETEFRLRRADGAYRWHIARAVAIKGGAEIVRWIGTNTDIQDQKEVSEALADINATLEQRVQERTSQLSVAEDALRQAQKMEAVGQLTGGIAHDFNNLLAAITGSLSLIERRLVDGKPGVDRYIGAARDAAHRAANLTQRLLAFSRRQTLDPKPLDANRLIAGMEDLIRRTVGPNIEIEVVGAGGLWATRVDRSQLENSLLNLCINARDAMAPNGGRLTIETANKWLDQRAARERDLPPGQYVSLCVTDTGTGMTPDVITRAFDPFFTTKPIGQGTGLGLSMIYGFVRQSGGQVRIYSELGKGTTMCLYLPRFSGEAVSDEPANSEDAIDRGDGETVLIIDDEASLRMLMTDVLEEGGYKTLAAPDGPSGLKILQSDARVDFLITDVGLPGGMNGRQVADAARTLRPDLKILFITGYAENAAIGNGHLDKGMEILTKPFEISALANKVREILES